MILRKPLVWSYSFLSTYANCARKGQAQYITKEVKWSESPEAKYGNDVHKGGEDAVNLETYYSAEHTSLNKYLAMIKSIPGKKGKLQAEIKLGVTRDWQPTGFFDDNVWGRGKLDVPIILENDNAIILDWKTGKEREDPLELEVQAVLLKAAYPHLKDIKGAYIWLKSDKFGTVHDLSGKLEETKGYILALMSKVERGIFYAQPNALCGWCDLTSCRYWKERKK